MPPADKILVDNRPFRARLGQAFKQEIPQGPTFATIQRTIRDFQLDTVCEAAKCPNRTHCYGRGVLTFQILGNRCTRTCGFCAEVYAPSGAPVDPDEPRRVVEAARQMGLKHVVITSPARDDLADDGAAAFVQVIRQFRQDLPKVTVEILTPDFRNRPDCLHAVFESRPDIFNHNIETVRRLTPKVRSKATYERSLAVLSQAAAFGLTIKSGFMVGHGETLDELRESFADLRSIGCERITVGQYLPPSPHHLPLHKIYSPEEFDLLRAEALQCGFLQVMAAPLVRSSYHAEI